MIATIDLERLAREAGFRTQVFDGEVAIMDDSFQNITDDVTKFAALVLKEAADAVDRMPLQHAGRADLTANQAVAVVRTLAASLGKD